MIPEEIVHFLETATVAIGGTRDRNLTPHVHRISGWAVDLDRRTITCLVAEEFTSDLVDSLEDNGQFALTVCEVPSHETYQFKGQYVGSRATNDADLSVFESCRERFVERMRTLYGFPDQPSRAFVPKPSIAVIFRVRDIFVQTPGPDAGKELAFE